MVVNNNRDSASTFSSTSSDFSNTNTVSSLFNIKEKLNLKKSFNGLTRRASTASKKFKDITSRSSQVIKSINADSNILLSRNNSFSKKSEGPKNSNTASSFNNLSESDRNSTSSSASGYSNSSTVKQATSSRSSTSSSLASYKTAKEEPEQEFESELYSSYLNLILNQKNLARKCTASIEFLEERNRFIENQRLNKIIEKLSQLKANIASQATDIQTKKELIEEPEVKALFENINKFIQELNAYSFLFNKEESFSLTKKYKKALYKLEAEIYAVFHLMFPQESNNEQSDFDSKIEKLKENIPASAKEYFNPKIQAFQLIRFSIIGREQYLEKPLTKDRFIFSFFLEEMNEIIKNFSKEISDFKTPTREYYKPSQQINKECKRLTESMQEIMQERL